ncbi:DMT family transporter [Peribacillus frigoritolerans]|uniref:DMT family transporter n=1 Tax=Peribacillus castrilensis TaxID=2897690 RepID=UPI00296F60BA|nr:multidrug efflux SMR transporter [Peribacillus castrilensis]
MKGYIALGISIISEVFGTTMLKLSEGFTHLFATFGVMIGFAIAFYSLSICLKTIPLSLAYAIWSGIGTALTALIGVLLWNEPFSITTLGGLVLIIGGVVLLNASHTSKQAEGESN